MKNKTSQFSYSAGDTVPVPSDSKYIIAMILAIVAIELEHPGSIEWAFRGAALSNMDFKLKSNCNNPGASIDAQYELLDWLDSIVQDWDNASQLFTGIINRNRERT